MILYIEDWKAYPTAIPNYSTTNKTWVRLAGIYHSMGVKNCLFHLALHNPLLKDIDPHADNLTQQEIAMIVDECTVNPWYVLREIIRVPPIAGVEPVPLRANRGNISLYWLFFNHITTLLIMVRQSGKSISTDALMVALMTTLTVNTDISLLTKDDQLRVRNIKRIKGLIEQLPKYFQLRTRKDSNNTEKITLERLGNTYQSSVAQSSKKAALNLGRGMTNGINHIDEIAYINNIKTTLPAFLASAGAARDAAEAAGAPYGNIFTTTPGYLSSESGEYAYGIYTESFRWTELLFDTEDEYDLKNKITTNTPGGKLQVVLDYNHRQLGYTDEWLRGKISDARSTITTASADFLNIWPGGAGSSLIPADKLKLMTDSRTTDANHMISTYGYIIKWYIPIASIPNRLIVAGLDTSESIGADGIGLILRDVSTGETLGSGDFNETNTITFAKWLAEFLIDYPNILLAIERKNTGVSIIDAMIEILLHHGVDPFKRIFNWVVGDAATKPMYMEEVVGVPFNRRNKEVYIKYRKYFGYTTTGSGRSSRDMLYGEIFNTSITYTSDTVRDPKLINQLSSLVIKNNRVDHANGACDDLVIAWLLAYYVLAKGENLEFYGIAPNKVLSSIAESKLAAEGGQVALDVKEYQLDLKAEIDELITNINVEKSPIKVKMMVSKLKYLYQDIDTNIIQVHSLSSLLENLTLEKRRRTTTAYGRSF